MTYRMRFRLPPGVHLQQTMDGLLIMTYSVDMIAPLRESLDKLRADLLEEALADAKSKLEAEKTRQQLPQDRLTLLNGEIQALEQQKSTAVPLVRIE